MAQKPGSKRSKFGFPRHHPGCIESLLQFAIFQGSWQQRLHLKKMIAYKRHTDTPRPPKIKVPKVQHCFIKEGSDLQVEECKLQSPTKSPKKSPTKSPRKDLFKPLKLKKKSTEKGHRRCITSLPPPVASRLVRTVSMHHKNDCNYNLPIASSDNQKMANNRSFSQNSLAPTNIVQSEHHKTCQHCGSVSGLNIEDQIHQSKDLLDFLQFFNQNKNLLMSIARNPQILLAKEPHEKQACSDEGVGLNKSETFPRPGMPKNLQPQVPSLVPKDSKSIRSGIKKAMKDNKKEVIHIANDGFLHKLPYGQKDREGPKQNYWKERCETKMTRSSSLIDSLDKYSNLFESISKEEMKPADSMTGLSEKTSGLVFKRIHSSPEIIPYSVFVPPLVTRSSPDIKTVNFSTESKPLDTSKLDKHEVKPIDLPLSTDEEAQLLDPQLCTNQVQKLDPESDDHEGIQPDIRENKIDGSSFSNEDTSAIYLKQSLSGSSLESENIDSSEAKLQEDLTKTEVVSHHDIEVNENDEAYFYFMKDMLEKSGITSNREWNSSKQPTLDPVYLELETDLDPEQLLLFDLINEALVDAYEASLLLGTWVPRCGLVSRRQSQSLQLGRQCMIVEVWGRVKRQLNSFVEVATEDVVAADFRKKKDGWMALNFDSELVGLDLEDWIIEDMVDEIVLEIGGCGSQSNPYF